MNSITCEPTDIKLFLETPLPHQVFQSILLDNSLFSLNSESSSVFDFLKYWVLMQP